MDKDNEIHQGGCLCGVVRYETYGKPDRAPICHCRYCQLRTGSAFGHLVYFPEDKVTLLSGGLTSYQFKSESGNQWENRFCSRCGTSIFSLLEVRAGLIAISAGTFDPPTFWFDVTREVFTRSKAHYLGEIVAGETHATITGYNPHQGEDERLSSKKP